MSVEQAIHELQEQLQRVSAGHQAMRQELTTLRSMLDTRSRVRLVEPKTLTPDLFGKKKGPSWTALLQAGKEEKDVAEDCKTRRTKEDSIFPGKKEDEGTQ